MYICTAFGYSYYSILVRLFWNVGAIDLKLSITVLARLGVTSGHNFWIQTFSLQGFYRLYVGF